MLLLSQFWLGLAAGSQLFLVAAGLTLIVGISRIANLSLGALAVVGAVLARAVSAQLSPNAVSTAIGVVTAALATAVIGALLDVLILRRLRHATVLFGMAATLGIALLIDGFVPLPFIAAARLPDPMATVAPMAVGLIVLVALLVLLQRTPWGASLRAAREDAALTAALGVDTRWLQTGVAALGAGLAGLAGAMLSIEGPIGAGLDIDLLTGALIVVVIGGLGSVTGAYVASLMVGLAQAFGALMLPHATLVPAVALMAVTLLLRPTGLIGRGLMDRRFPDPARVRPTPASVKLLGIIALLLSIVAPFLAAPDILAFLSEALIALLFAASLQVLIGPGGMPSLGHAAFFGIGAYAAAALIRNADLPSSVMLLGAPLAAGAVALLVGALIVRLPAVALAMVTLVFAQFVLTLAGLEPGWTVGLPAPTLGPALTYWITLALCIGVVLLLRRTLSAPVGYALRATRDDPRRALAIGIPIHAIRLATFTLAGSAAGLAGGLAMTHPGQPDLGTSLDGVLMVVLGGMQTLSGPILGAFAVIGLQQAATSAAIAWQPLLGLALIATVLLLPEGIAGWSIRHWRRGA